MKTETVLQKMIWDEKTNKCFLVTKYNETVKVEPLTSEEAALWTAQNRF